MRERLVNNKTSWIRMKCVTKNKKMMTAGIEIEEIEGGGDLGIDQGLHGDGGVGDQGHVPEIGGEGQGQEIDIAGEDQGQKKKVDRMTGKKKKGAGRKGKKKKKKKKKKK